MSKILDAIGAYVNGQTDFASLRSELIAFPWPPVDRLASTPSQDDAEEQFEAADYHQFGTWDEVRTAHDWGLLTDQEYLSLQGAVYTVAKETQDRHTSEALELVEALRLRLAGDKPGHPFHGNQWGPGGNAGDPVALRATVQSEENRIRIRSIEYLSVIGPDGKIIKKATGDSRQVSLLADPSYMKGATVTHNHPGGGSPFSPEDVAFACVGKLAEMRACDRRGAYSLKPIGRATFTPADWHRIEFELSKDMFRFNNSLDRRTRKVRKAQLNEIWVKHAPGLKAAYVYETKT